MNNTLGLSSLLTSMGSNQSSNDVGTTIAPNNDDQLQKMAQQQAYQNAIAALSPSNTGGGAGMQDMSQISSIQPGPKKSGGGMDIGAMMSMAKSMQGGGMGAAGASGGAAGSMGAPGASGAISGASGGGAAVAGGGLSNTAVLAAESDRTSKESIRKLSAENKELKAEVKQNALENMYAQGDPLNMIMPTWDTSKPVAPPPPPRRVMAAKPVAPPPPPPYVQEYGYFMPPPPETYSSYEPVSTMPEPPITPAYNYSPPPPNMSAMPNQYSSSDESKKKDIKPVKGRLEGSEIQEFLDGIHPYSFKYKNPEDGSPIAPVDDRYLGVMAQDVEKTPTGKTLVKTDNRGKKMLEVAPMMSALAASAAYLNDRVKNLENKKG